MIGSRYTARRAELPARELRAGLAPGWEVVEHRPDGPTHGVETWDTRQQARAAARARNDQKAVKIAGTRRPTR